MIYIISIVLLTIIAVGDFRSRSIYLWALISELLMSAYIAISTGVSGLSEIWIANISLTVLFVSVLYLWILYKKRKSNILNYFAGGDIFILVISALNFSPLNFIFFITVATSLTLIIWLTCFHEKAEAAATIPFAGFISIYLIAVQLISLFIENNLFYDDLFLLNLIYGY